MSGCNHGIDLRVSLEDGCDRKAKFLRAVEELAKAMRVRTRIKDESAGAGERPLRVAEETEKEYKDKFEKITARLIDIVSGRIQKAGGDDPAEYLGRMLIGPTTGRPITKREWKRFLDALDGFLEVSVSGLAERMAARQTAAGAMAAKLVYQGKVAEKLRAADLGKLPSTVGAAGEVLGAAGERSARFAEYRIGLHLTSVSERLRSDIAMIVNDGIQNKQRRSKIVQRLFEAHGEANKDWERIVNTECQNAFANGWLIQQLEQAGRVTPGARVYVIGTGMPDACPICKRDIIGKVAVLLPEAPEGGDEVLKDPWAKVAIWPGKTSVGMKARDRWSVVTRHPWCRCLWNRWYPPE